MRKNKLLIVLLLPILFLLPFSNYANAQGPDYVGVAVGEQYTWKAEAQFGNVDTLLDNAKALLVDWKDNLPTSFDLFGLESLTIAEIYEQMAEVYLSNVLPVGWEGLNISTLIKVTAEDYIEKFNATFLSGMIPSNWLALNFSDFYNLAVDGINATLLPTGWENNPLPELFKMVINEINSDFLNDLIPSGWETMTIGNLFESLMMDNAPVLWESFVVQMMLDTVISMGIPTEILDATPSELIDQLVATFPSEITSLNATTLFEQIFYGIISSMPGIESESMGNIIDMFVAMVNQSMPMGYGELTMMELLELGIDELMMMMLPLELQGLTIVEILDMAYTQAISLFDSIIDGWDSTYSYLQASGMTSFEVGLRVEINYLGSEIDMYDGGPKGVPIDMDYLVSLDFENWTNIEDAMYLPFSFSPIMLLFSSFFYYGTLSVTPLIVDPSTYILAQTALADQAAFTGALIVANNYDWTSVQTELTMVTSGNLDAIEMSADWNSKGVLQNAYVKTDGLVVVSISLIGAGGEIPGYELPIILGFTTIALIAIIFTLKRKNNIK